MWGIGSLICYFILTIVESIVAGEDVEIVPMSEWGARPAKWVTRMDTPVDHVFIGHTVTPQCFTKEACSARMRQMQAMHMDNLGWSDIGYSFVIGSDGRVYEGTGWSGEGVRNRVWDSVSYEIGFVGNFMSTKPSGKMLYAARKLIIYGIKQGYISQDRELHGARDGTCTLSPGDALYDIIKLWPRFKGGRLEGYSC